MQRARDIEEEGHVEVGTHHEQRRDDEEQHEAPEQRAASGAQAEAAQRRTRRLDHNATVPARLQWSVRHNTLIIST